MAESSRVAGFARIRTAAERIGSGYAIAVAMRNIRFNETSRTTDNTGKVLVSFYRLRRSSAHEFRSHVGSRQTERQSVQGR
ncbi:hypothetical protein RB2015 [Rhodopirellula baltica SH 1]|uniref:Uncharacterized protein n=1 Tax=Rhodopirellula baltica (strain DSM 10527 / NCIMB 13988 / SH1) TaxID=243090 RepID=Q7UWI4_RHOBA|nr:hypothetical protein RB2015 [Rhodopirellula baltica SH 1]